MYKVCFVDDEIINYKLFEKMVNWEEKGFEIAGTAGDGLEALQMYEEVQPDLIFMDIQLPLMDGLECVRCIREENKDVQIVIVSAYGQFDYAQKAIRYGVQDFLLKPVSRIMLNQIVDKVRRELDDSGKQKAEYDLFQNEMTNGLLEMSSNLKYTEEVHLPDSLRSIQVLVKVLITQQDGNRLPADILKKQMTELVEKQEIRKNLQAVLPMPDSSITLVWDRAEEEIADILLDFFADYKEKVEIYLWNAEVDRQPLEEWLKRMTEISNFGFYKKESGIYEVSSSPFQQQVYVFTDPDAIIIKSLAENEPAGLEHFLQEEFRRAGQEQVEPQMLKNFALDVLVKMKYNLNSFGKRESFSIMRNIRVEEINEILSAEKLFRFLLDKSQETFQDLNKRVFQAEKTKSVVFRANAFASLYYGDPDFSVQKVAEYIGISKNYFTSLYKEQAGTGFWEYVTELRMQKAKEALLSSERTAGTIAREIGYESEYHFSRKFKEYTGKSPNQFRKTARIQEEK